jgi:hypothetical protein
MSIVVVLFFINFIMAKQTLDLAGEGDVQKTTSTLKIEIGDSKSDTVGVLKV